MDDIEVGRITVIRRLDEGGGDTVDVVVEPSDMPVVEILGLLELAKGYRLVQEDEDD